MLSKTTFEVCKWLPSLASCETVTCTPITAWIYWVHNHWWFLIHSSSEKKGWTTLDISKFTQTALHEIFVKEDVALSIVIASGKQFSAKDQLVGLVYPPVWVASRGYQFNGLAETFVHTLKIEAYCVNPHVFVGLNRAFDNFLLQCLNGTAVFESSNSVPLSVFGQSATCALSIPLSVP